MKSPMRIRPRRSFVVSLVALSILCKVGFGRAEDPKDLTPFETLAALNGTWVSVAPGPDGKPAEIAFHVTANGSAVIETMFPGSNHEMMNAYHMDGESVIVTHYCAQGVQPRMKLASNENGVLKFEFLDGTNLKPGEAHMGALEITVSGETLVEKWSVLQDGKATEYVVLEMKRKA